jgi:hypothetical protein
MTELFGGFKVQGGGGFIDPHDAMHKRRGMIKQIDHAAHGDERKKAKEAKLKRAKVPLNAMKEKTMVAMMVIEKNVDWTSKMGRNELGGAKDVSVAF